MKRKIQLRRGTAQEWENKNPVLAAGEPGVEIDTGYLKIGDGETAWDDLDYLSGEGEAGGMEVHGNEYHDPDFATTEYVDQSVFSGSYNDLTDVPSEFMPEEHGNEKHDPNFATESALTGKADDPHGNESHDEDYITETEEHGNEKHSVTFENTANKGQPNGYASLDGDGLVPENQLPETGGMEEHGNEHHDPNFATESALNGKADDPHGNESHDEDYITETEEHGNEKHSEDYITETEEHGNEKHSDNYATTNGTYWNLRARATTKDDVGLGNVDNYKQARSPDGYEIQKDGTDGNGIINFKT